METMTQALEIANGFTPFSDEWQAVATVSGGWQLRLMTEGGSQRLAVVGSCG